MFEQYKMVMVVRADLKMGKGNIAAQVRLMMLKTVCVLISLLVIDPERQGSGDTQCNTKSREVAIY